MGRMLFEPARAPQTLHACMQSTRREKLRALSVRRVLFGAPKVFSLCFGQLLPVQAEARAIVVC